MKRTIRRSIGILIIIIISIGIVYRISSNGTDDTVKVEPAVYQDLLSKYERTLKDPTLQETQENHKRRMVCIIGSGDVLEIIQSATALKI